MADIDTAARPAIGAGFRLQWEPAQEAHVLLYPEGMVRLSRSAAAIMTRCDGERSIAAIVADIEGEYSTTGLSADVHAFIRLALERSWLELRP
jgi:pyrroloquinoline quinone biosynthesis protein D